MKRQSSLASFAASALASVASLADAASSSVTLPPRSPGKSPPLAGVSSEHATNMIAKIGSIAMKRRTAVSVASFALLALAGCSSSADKAPGSNTEGPGASVVSDIISCQSDSDCKSGEACGQGFCQMKRCAAPSYTSSPPLGRSGYAFVDRAFIVGQADTNLQIFTPYAKGGSQIGTDAPPLDITGGNLTGTRPEPIAFVSAGAQSITVLGADGGVPQRIALDFQATRIAAGDIDGDGIDEIVVLGGSQYAVCNATTSACRNGAVGSTATDVTVADINGDGYADIVFLANHTIITVDVQGSKVDSQPLTPALVNIAAGDLDGDGKAEIFGTEAAGTFSTAKFHVFTLNGILSEQAVTDIGYGTADTQDVVFAKQDDKPVAGVLSDSSTLQTFTFASRTLTAQSQATVANYAGKRLAASDVNGRSAMIRLKGEPTLRVGPPVPLAVLTLPPYSGQHSAGPSSVTMGTSTEDGTSESHGQSDTTSASLNLSGSISANLGPVSPSISRFITYNWGHTTSHSESTSLNLSIGASYTVSADPSVDGYNSGGVVLAGGCFHQYDYEIDDPQHVLNAVETLLATVVPVGGETTLWSTARYNALVDALADGRLPKVAIAPKLGNVESYPTTPTTLDGQPIPDADNVFLKTPSTRTSDVGTVGFSLSATTSTTNTDANAFNFGTSVGTSISTGINIAVVQIHGQAQWTDDTSTSLDQSYSVTVGTSASFSGQISPVRDDPSTPANEASLYGYSFTPYLYRHHYKDGAGQERAFYAVTYTTGD